MKNAMGCKMCDGKSMKCIWDVNTMRCEMNDKMRNELWDMTCVGMWWDDMWFEQKIMTWDKKIGNMLKTKTHI